MVWTDLETGQRGISVVIEGPKEAQQLAAHALYARGLGNASYPDHGCWSRR